MAEKPEDLSLPASVISRIVKESLPEGVNVSKDAKTAIGRAASIFILYATTCANNFALKSKRKTISANDIFQALEDMELEDFVPELKNCLEAYKHGQQEKKEAAADRKRKQLATQPSSAAKREATGVSKEPVIPSLTETNDAEAEGEQPVQDTSSERDGGNGALSGEVIGDDGANGRSQEKQNCITIGSNE